MTLNPQQFGDPPVPEGHVRMYRGDWAPGGDPERLKNWLRPHEKREATKQSIANMVEHFSKHNKKFAARTSVQGRWVTPDPELAKSYPYGDAEWIGSATLVNYVDVPHHVWEQSKNLADQPTDVKQLSRMVEHEAIVPKEYQTKFRPSREHSPQAGLDIIDNQDTYL
jgi:hypothetical protein